jgi:probable addiction module antidote protein
MKRERKALPAAVPHEDWLFRELRDAEFAAEYLNAALAEGDQAAFMLALRDVARARGGISLIARHSQMNRVALSRALSMKGNPELRSLSRILDASGLRFVIAAKKAGAVRKTRKRQSKSEPLRRAA